MAEHEELAPPERRFPERVNHRLGSVIEVGPESSDTYSHLRAYWHILFKRRWTVLTVTFVVATLAAVISFKTRPVYEATARVEVEAETPEVQSLNDVYRSMSGVNDDSFLQTQVDVLKSENLAWRTLQQLGLGDKPGFAQADGGAGRPPAESEAAREGKLISAFRAQLRVNQMRDSRMVEVTFSSTDPQLAARAANAVVNNFAEYSFHQKYDATRQASGFMEQQLDELKAKVEKSQQAMVDYERQHAIVDIGDKQDVVEQRLAGLSQDLTAAQNERMQKQSLYEQVSSKDSQAALIAQNELLQRLEEKLADLRGQYVDALGQYGPNFPKVLRLRDQVKEDQSAIERERNRVLARIRNDYQAAQAREKLLSAAVGQEKVAVGNLSQLLIQHNLLKHEFETNQQLYESLLKHLKDATVSAGLRATNIHIVDPALVPTAPVRPKIMNNIAVGLLVGLVLGVTFAFVRESLDNSMKSAEDLERLIPAPALAVILKSGPSWRRIGRGKSQPSSSSVELVVLKRPLSSLAESYRSLRTAVLLSTAPRPPQALLVTSAQPGEGKTCTAVNLALGLAQRGVPVLIVDADMRRPGVSRGLDMPENGKGLSSVLSGAHSLDEVLRQYEAAPNLWVLPAGPRPPNPADLLASPTMAKVLQELRQRFEHVVVDSPPLLLVTDATIVSTLVDGVVLVVESGVTTSGAVVRAHKILESAGGRILGTVLNKLDLSHDGYYGTYYRSSHYSYYLGDHAKSAYYHDEESTAETTRDGSLKS
ncbi:MAG: GumC family protein [Terriglobia bacterium]